MSGQNSALAGGPQQWEQHRSTDFFMMLLVILVHKKLGNLGSGFGTASALIAGGATRTGGACAAAVAANPHNTTITLASRPAPFTLKG
jgi:hypothetical protein